MKRLELVDIEDGSVAVRVGNELDDNGEVRIDFNGGRHSMIWLSKEDSKKLVKHLTELFDLGKVLEEREVANSVKGLNPFNTKDSYEGLRLELEEKDKEIDRLTDVLNGMKRGQIPALHQAIDEMKDLISEQNEQIACYDNLKAHFYGVATKVLGSEYKVVAKDVQGADKQCCEDIIARFKTKRWRLW